MMKRREFLAKGAAAVAGLTLGGGVLEQLLSAPRYVSDHKSVAGVEGAAKMVDKVALGDSGLMVSRLALGTGSVGGNGGSNQTRLGYDTFTRLFHHAYDRGVRFVDMAEGYGSMPYVGEAIRGLPREELTLLSKMWPYPVGSSRFVPVMGRIEDYLRQVGTDYLDSLLLHCMTSADWNSSREHYMEEFEKARDRGLIRTVGVSCHDLGALKTAAEEPWVQVIFARINPFGVNMDGPVEDVVPVLQLARRNGKGVVGMKIFGEGSRVADHEREESIRFAIHDSGVHALTIGMETVGHIDDAADRVIRLAGL